MRRNVSIVALILLILAMLGCGIAKEEIREVIPAIPSSTVSDSSDNSPSAYSTDVTNNEEIDSSVEMAGNTGESDVLNFEEQTNDTQSESGEYITKDEAVSKETVESMEEIELDKARKNSIAMLNYLAVLSQEINSSKNSRLYLEKAYAALINNTNPEGVSETTESQLASLLDIIEKYRMITVKRDRLQYIYEQNKAKALKEAVPNPIGLLSAVQSFDVKRLVTSTIYMAVDSYSSYKAYNAEIDLEYLQSGWELDDEEAANVHDSRKRAFIYMLDIVREQELRGKQALQTLNETSVDEYVKWKNNANVYQKLQFFKNQESTYEAFGDYWLTLASCYYEYYEDSHDRSDYEKCLQCFEKYEKLQANIFRKDYSLANALPIAIAAAREIYSKEEYVLFAESHLKTLVDNTENTEWSLKYFAAQMYLDLYVQTKNNKFLDEAYKLAKNNVNYLVGEQESLNKTYLEDVKEVSFPDDPSKDASKDEKKSVKEQKDQIKKYNAALKEKRKIELPPVYEPLLLNCELLFALADEKDISSYEKNDIDGILHHKGNNLFLTEPLDNRFTYSHETFEPEVEFANDTLTIPVSCLSETSFIRVTVSDSGEESVYEDWQVKKVDRKSSEIESFKAVLTSKNCGSQKWSATATVKVEIFDKKDSTTTPFVINFKVNKYKAIPVLPDTVTFEQVR